MVSHNFGNWMYQRKLGAGGFGIVELWKEQSTNKRIAIKRCLSPVQSMTEKKQSRWRDEIVHMNEFDHPNIVKSEPTPTEMVFDSPVLCMEYCSKGDLRKELNKPENSCGLIQDDVISVMKDISSAVKYLHNKKVAHRDIKPENVVIQEKEGTVIYKLIDLGYAKDLGTATQTNSLVGTISYVAPELFYGTKYTQTVDFWGLGILFFEVLTGYKPFSLDVEIPQCITSLRGKKTTEICARLIDGNIQFYDHVVYPNDLSIEFLDNLNKWFQSALQWDPKKRGKRPGTNITVIFDSLKQMFPWKIIHIFSVTLYQLDHYYINRDTTILEMKQWIQNKTAISEGEQIIVDVNGVFFNELESCKKLSEQNIPESTLYVYKNCDLEVNQDQVNDEKIPEILETMLVEPEKIKTHQLLRECFTAMILSWRRDTILFKHYVFALGIKVDIIKNKLEALKRNNQESFLKAQVLMNKICEITQLEEKVEKSSTAKQGISNWYDKIKKLYNVMNGMKTETESFSDEIQKLFDTDVLFCELQNYQDDYEDFLTSFSGYEKEVKFSSDSDIKDKVKSLSINFEKFEDEKVSRFQKAEIRALVRGLMSFEKKLFNFSEGNFSSTQLLESYEKQLSALLEKRDDISTAVNIAVTSQSEVPERKTSLISCDDAEIKDSIVLRTVLDLKMTQLGQDIQRLLDATKNE